MTTSPVDSRPARASTVDSVGSPAGTMIQIARGGARAETIASIEVTPLAPAVVACATASALRSYATTTCPPRVRRVTMLRPIRPRPTKPSCIVTPEVRLKPDTTYEQRQTAAATAAHRSHGEAACGQ